MHILPLVQAPPVQDVLAQLKASWSPLTCSWSALLSAVLPLPVRFLPMRRKVLVQIPGHPRWCHQKDCRRKRDVKVSPDPRSSSPLRRDQQSHDQVHGYGSDDPYNETSACRGVVHTETERFGIISADHRPSTEQYGCPNVEAQDDARATQDPSDERPENPADGTRKLRVGAFFRGTHRAT